MHSIITGLNKKITLLIKRVNQNIYSHSIRSVIDSNYLQQSMNISQKNDLLRVLKKKIDECKNNIENDHEDIVNIIETKS